MAEHHRPLGRRQGTLAVAVQAVPLLLVAVGAVAYMVLEDAQILVAVLVALLGSVAMVLRQRFRIGEWNRALRAANRLLQEGETERAALVLDTLAREARTSPTLHSCALVVLALTWMRMGEREVALALLRAADEGGWLDGEGTRAWRVLLLAGAATATALGDELAEAAAYRDRARSSARPVDRAAWIVADAVVEVKRGRFEAFVAGLEGLDPGELPETQANLVAILRAFALDRLGRHDDARAALARSRRPRSHETRLLEMWPELGAFVDANEASMAPTSLARPA
jgi:hypothetical protein